MLIYRVTNTVNGKVYIGKWIHPTVDRRWRLHKSAAKSGSPYYFHRAIRKYGSDAFKVEVIDKTETSEELSEMEKRYIALYHSNDPSKGYNMTEGGEGTQGYTPTEAWRNWKSEHSKKWWDIPNYREKQTVAHQEWWTPERRKEKALQLKQIRESGRDPRRGTGKGPGTGQLHSAETKVKLSAMKNKPVRCLSTGEVFPSLTYVIKKLGGGVANLSRAIRRGHNFFGRRFEYAN